MRVMINIIHSIRVGDPRLPSSGQWSKVRCGLVADQEAADSRIVPGRGVGIVVYEVGAA